MSENKMPIEQAAENLYTAMIDIQTMTRGLVGALRATIKENESLKAELSKQEDKK
jgi:hypothetical protein